ncbi:MAG: formyltransferase family protein [Thalassobaculum sp.]|uniref:methionyl-tRNA formyltransferase n=1 Tax=Thalassobaculum sp. TaxID=2022740 RepID=UPI0032F02C46
MAEGRLIRWVFAGGKPQGIRVLQHAIECGWPPDLIVWPPELPAADLAALRGLADSAEIPTASSSTLEERIEELARFDLLLTCRFGLLKPAVFEAPRLGAINVHSSLLPLYRGVHPVAWALVRGEQITGVTVHRIDANVDTGPILASIEVPVASDDDIWTLTAKLDAASAVAVAEVMEEAHRTGRLPPGRPQTGVSSRAPRRRPEDGRVDWSRSARGVYDLCRALRPPLPPPFAFLGRDRTVRFLDFRPPVASRQDAPAGTVVATIDGGWYAIACVDGVIELRTDIELAPGTLLS